MGNHWNSTLELWIKTSLYTFYVFIKTRYTFFFQLFEQKFFNYRVEFRHSYNVAINCGVSPKWFLVWLIKRERKVQKPIFGSGTFFWIVTVICIKTIEFLAHYAFNRQSKKKYVWNFYGATAWFDYIIKISCSNVHSSFFVYVEKFQ